MICIGKTMIAWVVLMFVGTNLLGFVTRGLAFSTPPLDDVPTEELELRALLEAESRRMGGANHAMTLMAVIATIAYIFALAHFWNIGLAIAGILLMASRLPDLLNEIRA